MRKLLAVLFCASFLLAGGKNVPARSFTSAVHASLTATEVEKAIAAASVELSWIPRPMGEGTIEAKLLVRTHELIVDVAYTATEYTINYKSSKNLNYDEKTQTIHRKYEQWVRNLNARIQKKLLVASLDAQ